MQVALGPASALGAALAWSFSTVLFEPSIAVFGARALNLFKCAVATGLFAVTLAVLGIPLPGANQTLALFLSGVVGVGVGDIAYFSSQRRIGASKTALLQNTAPIFTAMIDYFAFRDVPTPAEGLGVIVVLAGISLVVTGGGGTASRDGRTAGILLALVAGLCQAAGIALAKDAFLPGPPDPADPLAGSAIRLGAAALTVLVIACAARRFLHVVAPLRKSAGWRRLTVPTLVGTYGGICLMMYGIRHTPSAAVASALLAVMPVFTLFTSRLVQKQPITLRGLLGTAVAVAGIIRIVTAKS